jgi:hypothetical protein
MSLNRVLPERMVCLYEFTRMYSRGVILQEVSLFYDSNIP